MLYFYIQKYKDKQIVCGHNILAGVFEIELSRLRHCQSDELCGLRQ